LGDEPKKVGPIVAAKNSAPVSSGSSYVQLASVKTRLAAESEWTKLRAKYGLGSAYRIQQKDLGEKGTFFRIQAGPYSKEDAALICTDIKKKSPGGCLVTK
jgi:cell division septation protein DedD